MIGNIGNKFTLGISGLKFVSSQKISGGTIITNAIAGPNLQMSYSSPLVTLTGPTTTSTDLIIKANSTDSYPSIYLSGTKSIHFNSQPTGGPFPYLFKTGGNTILQIESGSSYTTSIKGGEKASDWFKIKANSIDDYPYIDLIGGDSIDLYAQTWIYMFKEDEQIFQFGQIGPSTSSIKGGDGTRKNIEIFANMDDMVPSIGIYGSTAGENLEGNIVLYSADDKHVIVSGSLAVDSELILSPSRPDKTATMGAFWCSTNSAKTFSRLYFCTGNTNNWMKVTLTK
jgi:hypothetical protein